MNNNKPPRITLPSTLELPTEVVTQCTNGVNLHSINTEGAGVVRLSLVFGGGSSTQHRPFAAASTLSMLSEGSRNFTAQKIAETLDYYGIFYDNSTDRDYSYITIAALNKFLPQALELLEDMLHNPLFLETELEVYRNKKQEALRINESKPGFTAQRTFANRLFGPKHPYGRTAKPEDYDGLSTTDLHKYYYDNLHAGNMFAVSSGDITSDNFELIRGFIERIPVRETQESSVVFLAPAPIHPLQFRINRTEQTQCCLRLGGQTINKNHPDYFPFQLVIMVLGGYFGSRLMQNLREEKGYTYSVYSAIINLRHASYYAIATDTGVEHWESAVSEIHSEIERLKSELVGRDELERAKSMIVGEVMRLIDGPFGIADIAIENIQSGKSSGYLNDFLQGIQSTTPEVLRSVAQRHLAPELLTQIIG